MTRRNDKERSIPELKSDIRKLCYLVIRELMNDFSIYNRFPELKEHIKGVKLNGNLYDKIYYESLLAELKGDFVIGLCYLYSIAYVDFVNHCLTNRVMYLEDIDQGNPRSVRIKFSDRKIRDKTIARAVEKSLKGIRK